MARVPFEFSIGEKFTLTDEARENYGEPEGKVYTVARRFDHYRPAGEAPWDETGHPGFDDGTGTNLYESDALPHNAVYSWEMEEAE